MSSSPTTAVAAEADAVTVAEAVEKAPRRFPPPCWTQEEALALVDAYRERWYALRRGYLRTADWDAVAEAVAGRCPGASPAKTSAQCRHKMEKLRQRYRAEKQRALSFPHPGGRYFSSWFFFDNMEAMENGTAPRTTSVPNLENSGDGSGLKSFLDQNILKLKLKAKNSEDLDPDIGIDSVVKAKKFNSATKIPVDEEEDEDLVDYGRRQQVMNGFPKPVQRSKAKKSGKMVDNLSFNGGFQQEMLPQGIRIKKLGKFDPSMGFHNNRSNLNEEFLVNNNNSFRSKNWASTNPMADPRLAMQGLKRGRNDALEEIVGSIKLLGEGFVRMERAKMEMAREMEAMRMEMEMKRNEMLLQSQKQIVDAFVKGLFEMKKSKKVKTTGIVAADSAES